VRIALRQFRPSSENRRVLRKGAGIDARLIPRQEFDYTPERRRFYKTYADIKFGAEVMSLERLDSLFSGKIISHLLLFADAETAAEVGTVCLFLEPPGMAYYYFAFYDLNYYSRNLGMYMMTSAVALFAERGYTFLYLGTCYQSNALYKTQFSGAQFFSGTRWSDNLEELKYLVRREQKEHHLLESQEYLKEFCDNDLAQLANRTAFRVRVK
jgi:arginyl-tRNA--protein-N-Asp/Glu arginylyltransferase